MNDFIYIHLPNGRDLKIARRWANRQTGKELLGIGFTWNFVSKYTWNTIHIERYFGLFLQLNRLNGLNVRQNGFYLILKTACQCQLMILSENYLIQHALHLRAVGLRI